MLKSFTVLLIITLVFPSALFASPPDEPPTARAGEARPESAPLDSGQAIEYSPTAKKVYLGTGIGTLVAGGAFMALGVSESNGDEITSKSSSTALYVIGGSFLAASTILWILYFREKSREPAATVGLELDKGKYGISANFRF